MIVRETPRRRPMKITLLLQSVALVLVLAGAGQASAALLVVTPGEQNTASGENGCTLAQNPCPAGHWWHYPELLQMALGSGYTVKNTGDGGAILGCDAASVTIA